MVVVDAPCSGSGLFRKDPEAINEWSAGAVTLCSKRQQHILQHILPSLRQNGTLIYATCSYSKEENEDILDWIKEHFNMESIPITTDAAWNITTVQSEKHKAFGYRFFPDKIKGEGFFYCCI